MKRRRRTRFAVPFVTTFALAPACVTQPTATNPPPTATNPPPAAAPQVDTRDHRHGDGDGDGAGVETRDHRDGAGGETGTAGPPPQLPDPPEGWKVRHNEDGTCWAFAEVECPTGMACNPPPPRQVKCPAR
jgi:hypothetical protein